MLRLSCRSKAPRQRPRRRPGRRPRLEVLEDRLAPASIIWTDRASFTGLGPNTAAAVAVIDAAITSWQEVIDSFNYANIGQEGWSPSASYSLSVSVAKSVQNSLASGGATSADRAGKPFRGAIYLDNDGAGGGWYFDPNPGSDFEFTDAVTPFTAGGGPAGTDLYSVVVHEIGHALGFAEEIGSSLAALQNRINSAHIFTLNDGSSVTFEADHAHIDDVRHPQDLMNPLMAPSTRKRITDLDARVLAEAYGYSINQRNFTSTFDPATRQLIVHGDLGTTSNPGGVFDDIKVDVTGGYIFANVNGHVTRINQGSVAEIIVLGGDGNDRIQIGSSSVGQPITVNAGAGDSNVVILSYAARNLNTIQGHVRVFEREGKTNVVLYDDLNTAPRNFDIGSQHLRFGTRAFLTYAEARAPAEIVDAVSIQGGSGGNTFDVHSTNSTFVRLFTGTGNDLVRVTEVSDPSYSGRDAGSLYVDGVNGVDQVIVGATSQEGLRDIRGFVYVTNTGGWTDLLLDDSGDPNGSNVTLEDEQIRGLGPETIGFDSDGLRSLTIKTSNGSPGVGNRITVSNTPQNRSRSLTTTIEGSRNEDTFLVQRTAAAPLSINGRGGNDVVHLGNNGNMQGILGGVSLSNAGGLTALTLDDSANAASTNPALNVLLTGTGSVTRLAPGIITFREFQLSALTMLLGSGGNTLTINDTPQNVLGTLAMNVNTGAGADTVRVRRTTSPLPLQGGGGQDTVTIGNAGSLQGILAEIEVRNSPSYTALRIDGSSETVAANITIDAGSVTGLAPVPIRYVQGDLNGLTVSAGSGGNVITVVDTPQNGLGNMSSLINSGTGLDTVNILRTRSVLSVNGQNGRDIVNVGLNGSVQGIGEKLSVNNTSDYSTINLDDSADPTSRNVRMRRIGGGVTEVSGLAPGLFSIRNRDLLALNINGGGGGNTFTIEDTPLLAVPGFGVTNIRTGNSHDLVNIHGTSNPLNLDLAQGVNRVIVSAPTVGLNRLNGAVDIRGAGGNNIIEVDDRNVGGTHHYLLDTGLVHRTDKAPITFQDVSTLQVREGRGNDTTTIRDTSATVLTDVRGVGSIDTYSVTRTTNPLILGAELRSVIEVGSSTSSLDSIQGQITILGAPRNQMTLRLNDTAATTAQVLSADGKGLRQSYQRSGAGPIVVEAIVPDGLIRNFEYFSGSGGSTMFVNSTAAGTTSTFQGHSGVLDVGAVGFGTHTNDIQGTVTFFGQAADNDFAYYYEFWNPSPQTYTIATDPVLGTLVFNRPGTAPVHYGGLGQVVYFTPVVGGSSVNIRSVPAGTHLNMAIASDVVTLGSSAPGLGGTMSDILGPVSITGSLVNPQMTVILDDSGNTTVARRVTIERYVYSGYDYGSIRGLAPGNIALFDLYSTITVDIRGGALDDRFLMSGTPFAARISIDGGADNDVLVGTGGNILRGGAGRDLLIAGVLASQLFGGSDDDILIGGTTIHDRDAAALDELMAEWTSAAAYGTRVQNLRAGLLSDGKVITNGAQNTLLGEAGLDLFFGSLANPNDWTTEEM